MVSPTNDPKRWKYVIWALLPEAGELLFITKERGDRKDEDKFGDITSTNPDDAYSFEPSVAISECSMLQLGLMQSRGTPPWLVGIFPAIHAKRLT